jgi:hypothetical protein
MLAELDGYLVQLDGLMSGLRGLPDGLDSSEGKTDIRAQSALLCCLKRYVSLQRRLPASQVQ